MQASTASLLDHLLSKCYCYVYTHSYIYDVASNEECVDFIQHLLLLKCAETF